MYGSQLLEYSCRLGILARQTAQPVVLFRDQLPGNNGNPPVRARMSHQEEPLPHIRDAPAEAEKVRLAMPPRYAAVVVAAAQRYKLPVSDVVGRCTRPIYVLPRQILCYIFVVEMRVFLPTTGKWLGDRDHTTVIHAVRKIKSRMGEYEFVIDEICVAAGI